MAEFKFDEKMVKTIITKRAASEPLTTEEENYSRQMVNHMLDAKKSMHKSVKIVTGAEIRKGALDAPAVVKTPTYPTPETPNDNPTAKPSEAIREGKKLPDVDGKPATIYTENQRLADGNQVDVENPDSADVPQPTPNNKSADGIRTGDLVQKSVNGKMVKGLVIATDSTNHSVVKWATGAITPELSKNLVKAEKKVTPPNMTTEIPVAKADNKTKSAS